MILGFQSLNLPRVIYPLNRELVHLFFQFRNNRIIIYFLVRKCIEVLCNEIQLGIQRVIFLAQDIQSVVQNVIIGTFFRKPLFTTCLPTLMCVSRIWTPSNTS